MANDIGGFLLKLGIDVDKNSFENATKNVDKLASQFNKLIGIAKNAAVVASVVKIGDMASASYKTAAALGVATEKLNIWKAAANIAGVNANGLVSSMGQLASVMNHLDIDGKGLQGYSTQLGKLGLGVSDLESMSPDQAYQKIIETAQNQYSAASTPEEKLRVTTIVGDILGDAGQQFFIELQRTGTSIAEFLAGAGRTQILDDEDFEKGSAFRKEANTLGEETKSIAQKLGIEVGGILTPYLEEINNWIQNNGPLIEDTIEKIAKTVGIIADEIMKLTKKFVGKIEEGRNKAQVNTKLAELWTKEFGPVTAINQFKRLKYDDLPEDVKADIDANGGKSEFKAYIKDGIMRPNGQVTQVAPDDWVFAARNIGDMARAFIPQSFGNTNNVNAPNSYVINQTFNVNGGGNLAQTIRAQAYNGTRDGLMLAAERSSQRLQLMSGTL